MDTREIFEKALHIKDPWFISEVIFDKDQKKLKIAIDFKRGAVFHYESEDKKINGDFKAYDTTTKELRHLNFFEYECYFVARVPRVKDNKGGVHLVYPDWVGLMTGFSLLFEALVIQLTKAMPVHQVSKMIGESDYKVWQIVDKYVESTVNQNNYSEVKTVGFDETSITKGHNYVTIFVDLNEKKTIYVTEGRDAKTVEDFKTNLESHQGKAENIEEVSCDMSPAFISGLKKEFPKAQITFDKFHILKVINEAVDEVRRKEAASNPLLKGSRYVFLKNDSNLTKKQLELKQKLLLPKLNVTSRIN